MNNFLETNDIAPDELFREMKEYQGKTEDMRQKMLIDCLISASDYEHFYRIAYREGLKVHLPCGNPKCGTCALREGRPLPVVAPSTSSSSGAKESDSKGGYDEDIDRFEERRRTGGGGSKAEGKDDGEAGEASPSAAGSKGGDNDDYKSGSK
jgi:hypothetical protein